MAALNSYERNKRTLPLLRGEAEKNGVKESGTCLPSFEVLKETWFPNKNRKDRVDSTSFAKLGSIKFTKISLPYFEHSVSAGHPSNVDDPFSRHLDLSAYLIRHPKSTYYFKVTGYSMINAGINHRDLLVVDTALKPKHRDIVIAVINGLFNLKRFHLDGSQITLLSANPDYPSIMVTRHCYQR